MSMFICSFIHLALDAGCCYPAYWLRRVRGPGVLWFDLFNILPLILLCEFNTEHSQGPLWQKPDQVECRVMETLGHAKPEGTRGQKPQNLKTKLCSESETNELVSLSCRVLTTDYHHSFLWPSHSVTLYMHALYFRYLWFRYIIGAAIVQALIL